MFRLKKVCALLCSSMCLLGTSASANKDQKVYQRDALRMKKKSNLSKPVALAQSMDDFMNKEGEEAKKDQCEGWLVGFESILGGSRWGKRTKRAKAEGKLSVLNDPEVIEMLKKSNLDFFERETKNKKVCSNLLYIARWAAPAGVGVLGFICIVCVAFLAFKEVVDQVLEKIKNFEKSLNNHKSEIDNICDKNLVTKVVWAFIYSIEATLKARKYKEYVDLSSEATLEVSKYKEYVDLSSQIWEIVMPRVIAIGATDLVFGIGALSLASVLNYYSQKFQGASDELGRIGEKIKSKEAGSVVKAVTGKNTKAVDERKSKRRTLNRNPKKGNNAIQNRKRIKMLAR